MKIIEKMKKEIRMTVAIINFLSFFLPWVAISATGSTSVFGEVFSDTGTASITGFGLMEHSLLGILLYIIPVAMFTIPLVKSAKGISRYLYLILPASAIILMFLVSILVASGGGEFSSDLINIQTSVHRLAGFWIAGVCNVAIIVLTAIRDFHIKSTDDLKRNVKNADIGKISSQFSGAAKDIGSSIQNSAFVKCPKCGANILKGKEMCPKCGRKINKKNKK